MITDRQMELSTDQAITSSAANSENVYDAGGAFNLNENRCLEVVVTIKTTYASGTNLTFAVVDDDNAALSSATTLGTVGGGAIVTANLTAGAQFRMTLPHNTQRYVGVIITPSGTFTAGAHDIHIVETADAPQVTAPYDYETGR